MADPTSDVAAQTPNQLTCSRLLLEGITTDRKPHPKRSTLVAQTFSNDEFSEAGHPSTSG